MNVAGLSVSRRWAKDSLRVPTESCSFPINRYSSIEEGDGQNLSTGLAELIREEIIDALGRV
jgi:hypothetical protein